jgi:hypothetical protein
MAGKVLGVGTPLYQGYLKCRTQITNQILIYRILKRWQVFRANAARHSSDKGSAHQEKSAKVGNESYPYYLSAFLRFKNEGRFLGEWLCYHLVVGVEHFYLYNNNSSDDFLSVLQPFMDAGVVTLENWATKPASPSADLHCQERCRWETRWLACIDADEFLVPMQHGTIPELLREYEAYPALTANWRYFGSSGHQERPLGLVIDNYRRCQHGLNRHVKPIIDPRQAIAYGNSHYWIYRGWRQAVDENRREVLGSFNLPVVGNRIQINHYYTKSAEDYLAKCNPEWWVDSSGQRFPSHLKDRINEALTQYNEAEEPSILRFLAATRAKMQEFGVEG